MDKIEQFMKERLNEKGRLSCKDAFFISSKLKIPIQEVGKKAKDLEIKIDSCELGQFGKLEIGEFDEKAFEKLKPFLDENKKINCKDARRASSGIGLKKIRSTIKKSDIDVKYCELGCFKEKKGKEIFVKTKIWIENSYGDLLFGKGKTEVLELIDETGSIAEAAKRLDMSYKKMWTHLQILKKNMKVDFVVTKQGRSKDSGTFLTKEARQMIQRYKEFKKDVEQYADTRFAELFLIKNKKG